MNENIIEKIIDYLKENEEVFNNLIEDLDSYNGYLGDDRYYFMDDLNDLYSGSAPTEILTRAFYGYDATYGNESREAFNPNREYFYFNGYGNLVSSDDKDYSDRLDEYFIEECAKYRAHLYTIDNDATLTELFDQLEESEGKA